MTNRSLGSCLRFYRCRAGLTVREAAALGGISQSRLIAMELGHCQHIPSLQAMARAYCTTVHELVERADRIAWDMIEIQEPGKDPPAAG